MTQATGSLFIISAPSGAGKSSLVKALLATDSQAALSISHTTRAPRGQEQHGREYFFTSTAEFEQLVAQGALLEWAQVHGNCYGTAAQTVQEQLASGRDVILEIDYQGAFQVQQKMPQAQLIFILPPSMTELRARIEGEGGDAHVVELDVTDHDSIKAAVAHAETEMGSIDILVNNSGVSTTQRIQDVTPEDYDFIFNTNVKGAFFVAQEVGKRMLARSRGAAPGSFTGGRIINIASMAGLKVLPQIGAYCMSKAAVVQMTRAMALEWGKFGINTNAICPGYIDTEINHHHWQTEQGQKLVNMLPRKRVGSPEDLDALLVMLASDQSHFINGAVIAADDGFAV